MRTQLRKYENILMKVIPILYEDAAKYIRNVDAERLAAGYRKGRKGHKERKKERRRQARPSVS